MRIIQSTPFQSQTYYSIRGLNRALLSRVLPLSSLWVPLAHIEYITMRLHLDILDGDSPPLARVHVQRSSPNFSVPDLRQFLAEVHCVVDSSVEPHSTGGVVDVSGVTR